MKRNRITCLLLALALLLSGLLEYFVPAQAVAYENTYVNTGNQRADIVGVALTQLGYAEGPDNDTKYGTWCDLPYQPWCASFVSWCAEMADISPAILQRTGWAHPDSFGIARKSGTVYTPKPGDLFFTKNYSHVGIVYYVEGDYFYTIEGNSNDNGSDEGTGVFSNKRLISNFVFGIPDYKGTDPGHCYVSGQDSAHPHKRYYICEDCSDRYYTGSIAFDANCAQCTACGCSGALAGIYICTTTDTKLRIRSGHGTEFSSVGSIPPGGTVTVYAATKGGWAHIRYEAYKGYVSMEYLHPAPQTPMVSAGTLYHRNDAVQITWDAAAHADSYQLTLFCGDSAVRTEHTELPSYTFEPLEAGNYTLQVTSVNKAGTSLPDTVSFTVLDTYTVTYDPAGGTGAPDAQIKQYGAALVLSDQIPVRQGYVFSGWTDQPESRLAVCRPGDLWVLDDDVTLYALWRTEDSVPNSLTIATPPIRTVFLPGEAPDATGMVLHLYYSDGTGVPVTEGLTLSQLLPQVGTQTVTVSYEGLSVSYPVQVVEYIPGDFNGDRFVTEDDAMYLLRSVLFPDSYPVSIPAELTGDGQVNEDDAMYLLRHVLFPDAYPLRSN